MAARMRKQSDYSKFFSPVEDKVREAPKEQSTKSKKKRVIEEEDVENVDPSPNEESVQPIQKDKGNKIHKKSVEQVESSKQSEVKEKRSAPVKETAKQHEEREQERSSRAKKADSVSQEEYQRLKTKYEELKNIRETEVERLYEELKKSSKEKEETLNNLLQQAQQGKGKEVSQAKYQKELSKLTNDLSLSKIQVEELQLEKKRVSEKVVDLSSISRFFGMLTGCNVSKIDEEKYECVFVNSRDSSKVLSWNEDEIECTFDKQTTSISLPDYFSQTICFEPKELSPFLQQILSVLYKKDN